MRYIGRAAPAVCVVQGSNDVLAACMPGLLIHFKTVSARWHRRCVPPLLIAVICALTSAAFALDSALPPSGNFDLTHWKLTLPDAKASEVFPSQLTEGFTETNYFFSGTDGAMVFWCPVTGGITDSAKYPRSELREMFDPQSDNNNWTGYGTNLLQAQCKVSQIPSSKKVIIGQIHSFTGKALPLVKLQYNGGKVEALVKPSPNQSDDTKLSFGTADLDSLIAYRIQLAEGLLTLTVNDVSQSINVFETDPDWTNQTFYFKAGSYCQDNAGEASEGAKVAFYQLSVEHMPTATQPVPAVLAIIPSPTSTGGFRLQIQGRDAARYSLQVSDDLKQWNELLTTNAVSGIIDWQDETATNAVTRYYRAISL